MEHSVTQHRGGDGARIYGLPLRAFPGLIANAYVVIDGGYAALIDAGSGSADSNADLAAGFAALRTQWDEPLEWPDLRRIIITHGHVDHYGGLGWVQQHSAAPVAVHALDTQIVRDPRSALERQGTANRRFLRWAGAEAALAAELGALWASTGQRLGPAVVADELRDGMPVDGRFRVMHTPGHCAGQVCLRWDDVLFCADHVLAQTNPRLTPEHLEPHTGVAIYLAALDRVVAEPGVRLALAGHEAPMTDIYARIAALQRSHAARVEQIAAACATPRTIVEIAAAVYPTMQRGAQRLLAAQATAARVEYLVSQQRIVAVDAGAASPRFVS